MIKKPFIFYQFKCLSLKVVCFQIVFRKSAIEVLYLGNRFFGKKLYRIEIFF